MAIDAGPALGTGVQTFGLPGGPVVAGLEIHVGNPPSQLIGNIATGVNPLPPVDAPFVDPGQAGTTITGAAVPVTAKTFSFNNAPGVTVRFANPA